MNKRQKAELKRLADLAYERELGHWLAQLHTRFDEWQGGEITAAELSSHVHEFHQGPAREVWSRHAQLKHPEQQVAWGLAEGFLESGEVDPVLLKVVEEYAEAFRALNRE